jgi:KDO2-lipid IV(A) lauroyltransferase
MASVRAEPAAPPARQPAPVLPGADEPVRLRWAGVGDAAVLLQRILPVRALTGLAAAFGRLQYHLQPAQAAVVRKNLLPLVTNGTSVGALTRRFFEERQVRRMLLAVSARLDLEAMRALVDIRGREHLDAAVADDKGVILLLSHLHSLGAFLAVIHLRQLGYDIRVALPTMRDPWSATRLRRLLWRLFGREQTVPELIGGFPCQFNIRPIMKALGERRIVAQTGDGWHSASFVDCRFLGRTIPFPTGVVSVARTAGVPVVPVFATGPAERMEFVVDPPVRVGREPGAVEQSVRAYVARLEEFIRARPTTWEHWLVPDALEVLETWRERPLRAKYEV